MTNYYSTTTRNSKLGTGNYKHPFGWPIPGRQGTPGGYRFGFQGQEQDAEVTGSSESPWGAFKLRLYDGRGGRWFSPDILYQYHSSYLGMGNIPTMAVDASGGYVYIVNDVDGSIASAVNTWLNTDKGRAILAKYMHSADKHVYIGSTNIDDLDVSDNARPGGLTLPNNYPYIPSATKKVTIPTGKGFENLKPFYEVFDGMDISWQKGKINLTVLHKPAIANRSNGAKIIGHEVTSHYYIPDFMSPALDEHFTYGEEQLGLTRPGSLADQINKEIDGIRQFQNFLDGLIRISSGGGSNNVQQLRGRMYPKFGDR